MIKTYFINSTVALYDDVEFAWLQSLMLEEGILANSAGTTGMVVTQNGTPDMNVLVTAGKALVEITKSSRTFKVVVENDASVTVAIAANSSGSNRVDAIVVRVDVDAEPNLLKSNVGTIERVAGTGVSALSDGAITTALGSDGWYRLANITVSNGDTSIVTGDIADTRTKVATNDAITIRDNYTAQVIPAGMISPYAGAAAPSGFLLCDGSAVSRTTYANLFTAISDAFGGGDGSTTFNIPNLVRRFPLGKDTTSKVVVDDCEDTWNESTAANVTSEVDASDFKVGSNSVKLTVGSAVTAGTILATEVISSVNLRPYSSIYVWVKSSVTASAGDLQLLLDDTANCASPVYTLNMPALVANVWKRVKLDLTHPTNDVSMVSIGVKMVNDLGSFVLRLDDVSIGNGFEVGIAGGEEYHILKIAELAAHTHSAKVDPTSGGGGGSSSAPQNGQSGSTGGDQGHNTMPPFLTINYIIKT